MGSIFFIPQKISPNQPKGPFCLICSPWGNKPKALDLANRALELARRAEDGQVEGRILGVMEHIKGTLAFFFEKTERLLYIASRELIYPTLGKGKSSSKCHFWGIC